MFIVPISELNTDNKVYGEFLKQQQKQISITMSKERKNYSIKTAKFLEVSVSNDQREFIDIEKVESLRKLPLRCRRIPLSRYPLSGDVFCCVTDCH